MVVASPTFPRSSTGGCWYFPRLVHFDREGDPKRRVTALRGAGGSPCDGFSNHLSRALSGHLAVSAAPRSSEERRARRDTQRVRDCLPQATRVRASLVRPHLAVLNRAARRARLQ